MLPGGRDEGMGTHTYSLPQGWLSVTRHTRSFSPPSLAEKLRSTELKSLAQGYIVRLGPDLCFKCLIPDLILLTIKASL